MRSRLASIAAAAAILWSAGTASALTVPFTEEFAADTSGWENATNGPLDFEASGGPDGSSHVSTQFNYFGFTNPFGGGPVTFRASSSDDASGGAFVGDWVAGGVVAISAWVYQETGVDLTYFLRVANAFNFPGAVLNNEQVVPSGVWTELTWVIDTDSPLCFPENTTCLAAFQSVANLQFGTSAPAALTELDQAFTLAIDEVSITNVPEPGTTLLLGSALAGLAAVGRRRS